MATIGPAAAVADIGPLQFNGFLAWLAWLFIHLLYIAEFDNRLLILIQWAYNYFTRNRGARLITGSVSAPPLTVKEMAKTGVEYPADGKRRSRTPRLTDAGRTVLCPQRRVAKRALPFSSQILIYL